MSTGAYAEYVVEPSPTVIRRAVAAATQPGFLRLVAELARNEFIGAVDVTSESSLTTMFFSAGQIVHASMPDRADALGHVLYDMQMIDRQTYLETMRMARAENKLHGEILLSLQLIDERRLHHALGVQLFRKLRKVLAMRNVALAVRADAHLFGANERLRQALPGTKQVVHLAARLAEVSEILDVIRPMHLRHALIPSTAAAEIARFGFGAAGVRAAERLLSGPIQIRSLFDEPEERGEVAAAVTAMALTGVVELMPEGVQLRPKLQLVPETATAHPEIDVEVRVSAPEPRLPPQRASYDDGTARELRQRLDAIGRQDHFQVLELKPDAGPDSVREAFLKLAKRFHPDRITALGLGELAVEADLYFQRISEAKATLCDVAARARYFALLEHKEATGQIERSLEAERSFHRGEQMMARGDFSAALEQYERAVANNTDEPVYRAAMSWARYMHDRPSERVAAVREAKRFLWKTIQRWPESSRAYLYMARVLADNGDLPMAIQCLRKATDMCPPDFEISRELRLFERRHDQHPGRRTFFGGLFR